MVVVEEAHWRTMKTIDKRKIKGTKMMPLVVPDPPQVGELAREDYNRLLVLWPQGPQGPQRKRVLEEKGDSNKAGSSRRDIDRHHRSHFAEGSERVGSGPALVMKLKANWMRVSTLKLEEG